MDDYTLKSAEKQAILRALRRTRGNKRSAASLLECGKTTLYRKIDQYKIEKKDWESIPISELPKPPSMDVISEETSLPDVTDSTSLMSELTEDSEESTTVESEESSSSRGDLEIGMSPTSDDFPITDVG